MSKFGTFKYGDGTKYGRWERDAGYVKMKSKDQDSPLTMDDDAEYRKMKSKDQDSPLTMDDSRIL